MSCRVLSSGGEEASASPKNFLSVHHISDITLLGKINTPDNRLTHRGT